MHPAALSLNCTCESPREVPPLIALPSGSFRPRALYAGLFRRFVLSPHHSTEYASFGNIAPVGPPACVRLGVLVQLPRSIEIAE